MLCDLSAASLSIKKFRKCIEKHILFEFVSIVASFKTGGGRDWFGSKHMSRAWLISPSSPIVLTRVESGKMSKACIDTCFVIQLSEIDLRTIDHEFRNPMSHHLREHSFQEFSQSILPGKAPSSVTHKSKAQAPYSHQQNLVVFIVAIIITFL